MSPLYLGFHLCSNLQCCDHHLNSAEIVPDFLKGRFSTIEENKHHGLRCKNITSCFKQLAIVSITVEYIFLSQQHPHSKYCGQWLYCAEIRDVKLNKNTPIINNLQKFVGLQSLHVVDLYMTWCQILCTMRLQRVSKILTPRRMLQKTWLIA